MGLEYKTYDGVLYGVPHVLCTYAHIYNKDLCDAAGVDPTTFKSWDDVLNAVKATSGDGVYGYAMANGGEGRFSFRDLEMVALSNGFQPDDTSDATKPKYIETLQLFADMAPICLRHSPLGSIPSCSRLGRKATSLSCTLALSSPVT